MQTTAKVERKVLSQYITIYQSIISFSLEKMGLEVIIKHNKEDNDSVLRHQDTADMPVLHPRD